MKLLKKIAIIFTLLLGIFLISSNYYLKDKEKQTETVNATPINPSEYYYIIEYTYPIYLGSDLNYAYYSDNKIEIGIEYVDITNTVIFKEVDIEIIIYSYAHDIQVQKEIYYGNAIIDLTEFAINLMETDYIDFYIDYISSDWDTNYIEIDIEVNDYYLEDYKPSNGDDVEVDIPLRSHMIEFYIQNDFTRALSEFKFNQGESIGYENGYSEGESIGYDNGYIRGFGDGEKVFDFNFISEMFDKTNTFFSLEIYPGLKLWYLVAGPLIIGLIIAVLKFLR